MLCLDVWLGSSRQYYKGGYVIFQRVENNVNQYLGLEGDENKINALGLDVMSD